MFTMRRSIIPAALTLAFLVGSATTASARPGIWIYMREGTTTSISLINLTNHKLMITADDPSIYCQQYVTQALCLAEQSHPFQGLGQLSLDPYRSVTWRSRNATMADGDYAWSGWFKVLPEGMDEKWTVSANMHSQSAHNAPIVCNSPGKGTWFNLNTDWTTNADGHWSTSWNAYAYGLWVTPIGDPEQYVYMESVMTLSGKKLAVSMYSADNHRVTIVFRETYWDDTKAKGDDYKGWPLKYVSNSSCSVP